MLSIHKRKVLSGKSVRRQSLATSTSSDSGCSDIYGIVPQVPVQPPGELLSPLGGATISGLDLREQDDLLSSGSCANSNASSVIARGFISAISSSLSQEMVSVDTFLEFVRKKDLGRIKFALRENHFDIDSQDEVSQLDEKYINIFMPENLTACIMFGELLN